ncbi:hypothetical protein AGDE_05539 [Angomonas deanei]|uniref:Uncharacterized protein n=1 Tax=Angomonas deanei TaxID=59799 RepID=A0A7G2C3N6_9TRYP|nr:hypothetical protein AGDE_05539 [Angomonas deanei]CAD2214135.1 hypothetical protein, conserved [Angomonas deanei]|eukprot:EPY38390.1 hypothetical protein AGDE_05539 [Angomonas deanei]
MSTVENFDQTRLNYAQVVISLVCAVALLILSAVQLFFRTSSRDRQFARVSRQIRFDGAYLLGMQSGNKSRRIIEEGLKAHRFRIDDPPQYNREINPVVSNSRDSKQDCAEMLYKVRSGLSRTYGRAAELMTMRCCLSCMKAVQTLEQHERFLQIFESITFGVHRCNGRDFVTSDDIKFLHAFFYNVIAKELE